MSQRNRPEDALQIAVADARRAADGLVVAHIRARRGGDHVAPAVGDHARRRAADIGAIDAGLLQRLHVVWIAWPGLQ